MSRSRLRQITLQLKSTKEIKKTTNAMRLVSMSAHIKLRQLKKKWAEYKARLDGLLNSIKLASKKINSRKIKDDLGDNSSKLVIVVGAQKGLCGFFNAGLVQYFDENISEVENYDLLFIGKHLRNLFLYKGVQARFVYDEFGIKNVAAIAQDIVNYVLFSKYKKVIIYSTQPKGFFVTNLTTLILDKRDFLLENRDDKMNFNLKDIYLEQSYKETFDFIAMLALKATIAELFINSLLAEISARFLSMDTATQNAEDLIASLGLDYNKLRQASITRELTDLSGVLISGQE